MAGVASGYFAPFHVTNVAFPVVSDDGIRDLIDAGHGVVLLAAATANGNQFGVRFGSGWSALTRD